MLIWKKPNSPVIAPYLSAYINLVPDGDLINILELNEIQTVALVGSLTREKLTYRYEHGKWSIPQLLLHVIDTERIFAYRILRIARGDKTPLSGYEENDYAAASRADERDFKEILDEFVSVRRATISLLKSLSQDSLEQTGFANKKEISVLSLCYVIAGHALHHNKVIQDKYLS